MKCLLLLTLAALFANGFSTALADTRKKISVEVSFGSSYATALGTAATSDARALSEQSLVESLGDAVKYFQFVPSSEQAEHSLLFEIGEPAADNNAILSSVLEYYVFLTLNSGGKKHGKKLHWLFRDAASNLNGVDTPESIAASLHKAVATDQADNIIDKLLNEISFTDNASFKGTGIKGWIINHPRHVLCMHPDSRLKIHSVIPNETIEDAFEAQVRRQSSGDDTTTFTKAIGDVSSLGADPDAAEVVGVHVLSYELECAEAEVLQENSPTDTSFEQGGES